MPRWPSPPEGTVPAAEQNAYNRRVSAFDMNAKNNLKAELDHKVIKLRAEYGNMSDKAMDVYTAIVRRETRDLEGYRCSGDVDEHPVVVARTHDLIERCEQVVERGAAGPSHSYVMRKLTKNLVKVRVWFRFLGLLSMTSCHVAPERREPTPSQTSQVELELC